MLTSNLPAFPVLTTERLVLRALRPSDADRMFAMRSDPQVMQHVNRPLAKTIEDASALIDLINTMVAANDAVQWAITLKGYDEFIGLIGFWRIVKEHHYGELGYTLARDHWDKGYISEVIGALVPFGFNTLGFHRVEDHTTGERSFDLCTGEERLRARSAFQGEHLLEPVVSGKDVR